MHRRLAAAHFAASFAHAQPETPAPISFDVASVKPSPFQGAGRGRGGGCPGSFKVDRYRVEIRCANVATLIGHAYRLASRVRRPAGPDWIATTRYDIDAKFPDGATESQVPEMLQALLADRFKLVIHRETSEQEIYALIAAKGGPKLKDAAPETEPATPSTPDASMVPIGGVESRLTRIPGGYVVVNPQIGSVKHTDVPNRISRWEAPNIAMDGLAAILAQVGPLSADVVNMTGLRGRYQITLEIRLGDAMLSAAPPTPGDRAAMEAAIADMETAIVRATNAELQKYGLQLQRRKGPVETVTVDRVEKPSEN